MKKNLTIGLLIMTIFASLVLAGCSPSEDNVNLEDVHTAVKDAYGEMYIPSAAFDIVYLTDVVGLTEENVETFIAEGPMISTHVDTFIAIKATDGKGADIETELNAYRDNLINNTFQYPMNLPKIQASEVIRHGDYVFFVLLGALNDNMDATEEEALLYAQDQTKIGIDAINGLFE